MDRGGEVTTDTTSDMQGYENGGFMSPDATSEGMMNMLYTQSLPKAVDYGSLQDQDRIDRQNQEMMDMVTGSAGVAGSIKNIGKGLGGLKGLLKGLFKKGSSKKYGGNWTGSNSPYDNIPEGMQSRRIINYKDGSWDFDPSEIIYKQHGGLAGYENGGLARLLSKLSGADRRQRAYEELVPAADNVDMPLQTLNFRMPYESELSGSGKPFEPKMSEAQIASFFKGKEAE